MKDDIFSMEEGSRQAKDNCLQPDELLLSVERSFSRLHLVLSKGLSACWEGEACDAHRRQEEELFRDAQEAIGTVRDLLQQ